MALEKLAFGGEDFKYDTLAGIASRFAIGNRDIADVKGLTASSLFTEPKAAAVPVPSILPSETAVQAEAPENLLTSTTPTKSKTDEEQFISVPDSPTAAPAVVSPDTARHMNRTGPEGGAEPGLPAQELPWNQASVNIRSPLLRLHTEIVEFCRFLEPTTEEAAMREAATQRVRQSIIEVYASASVQVFGSFVTGLYLPTSDIDLVVMDSGADDVKIALKALSHKLGNTGIAIKIQVVANAKVPIIKFVEVQSNINFDISFDVANGPVAAGFVRDLMDTLPPMKPLVLVLKIFLQQRSFNEVYQGGIGSYALFVMVAAFLLLHPSRHPSRPGSKRAGSLENSLGVLLVDFFRLMGRTLNTDEVGISCSHGGAFYNKIDAEKEQPQRMYMLSVEDPADSANDLCRGSWNILKVKQAWDFAYQQLTAPSDPSESLLERIIRVDAVLTDRPPPADPEVPEQLEQQIREEMHHRSKHSRKEHTHRDKDSRHRGQEKEKDREGRHKDKKRRRERSLEYSDPDPDVQPDRARRIVPTDLLHA
ncbi:hypothetical protein WJX79_008048 [Trebouxia sp. C0005]